MSLQIGYAQSVITPSLERPVYLAGFGRNRRAVSVHDELFARVLALVSGDECVVVAALDLVGLGRRYCGKIGERVGVKTLIACTHTHHGPDTIGLWGPDETTSGVDTVYPERHGIFDMTCLEEAVVATILEALRDLQVARLRSTSTVVAGIARNARDEEILDQELTCLQFCRPDSDRPLVTWLTYPCHPEVLWDENPHISSDYIGPLRDCVEQATGAPCLATVGALGGMMTPNMPGHTFADADAMGTTLGRAALSALAGIEPIPAERLQFAGREFAIPLTNPIFRVAAQLGVIDNVADEAGEVITEANLIRLGAEPGVWLATAPGELLPKLGLTAKDEMRRAGAATAAVIGLVNDELGYILPEEQFIFPDNPFEPRDHYEETMSVGSEAGPRFMAALRSLFLIEYGDISE